jgi:hypothetical protein
MDDSFCYMAVFRCLAALAMSNFFIKITTLPSLACLSKGQLGLGRVGGML